MPTSFFAKTLRRGGLCVVLGAYPGRFVKWRVLFLGVVLVSFFYSGLVMVMLVVVWFVFGNVLVNVLCCQECFTIWTRFAFLVCLCYDAVFLFL